MKSVEEGATLDREPLNMNANHEKGGVQTGTTMNLSSQWPVTLFTSTNTNGSGGTVAAVGRLVPTKTTLLEVAGMAVGLSCDV